MNKSPEQRTVEMLVRLHFGRGRKGPPEDPAARKDHELTRGWGWGGNTLGIGIGEKHVNGQRQQGQRCLTILARRKRAKRHLSDSELIPPSLMLESVGERIVTDVIAVPGWGPHAQASPDAIFRPVQPGAGIGNGQLGTLGLLVRQGGNQQLLALSCSHVLAKSGTATPLDFIEQSPSSPPGQYLSIGQLTNDFTVLNTSDTFTEDVALATVTVGAIPQMVDSGLIVNSFSDATEFPIGMLVTRDGVGSQSPQDGAVVFNQVALNLGMPFVDDPGQVSFAGLVAYSAQNADGDSGAAVLQKNTAEVVGLHIGACGQNSLFQPIGPIMTSHDLTLFMG